MRVALGFAAAVACEAEHYLCETEADCQNGPVRGHCEAESACSFRDDACESGRRFGVHGPSDLAGRCVAPAPTEAHEQPETEASVEDPTAPTSCVEDDDCVSGYCGPDSLCHLGLPGDPCVFDEQCLVDRCRADGTCALVAG